MNADKPSDKPDECSTCRTGGRGGTSGGVVGRRQALRRMLAVVLGVGTAMLVRPAGGRSVQAQDDPLGWYAMLGTWSGHLVTMTVSESALVTIDWAAGRTIRDGLFVTSPDGQPDQTRIQIGTFHEGRALGRVIWSSDGEDIVDTPASLRLETPCLITLEYGGASMQLERWPCEGR